MLIICNQHYAKVSSYVEVRAGQSSSPGLLNCLIEPNKPPAYPNNTVGPTFVYKNYSLEYCILVRSHLKTCQLGKPEILKYDNDYIGVFFQFEYKNTTPRKDHLSRNITNGA